ncbi:MAG: dUTP diphosphatase [bacterium]|nr:dUTP diphosphatase [bacterium]
MKIRIKRFDKELPLPEHKTEKAACFDLTAREETKINPQQVGYVPLNNAIETPEGYFLLVAARSSTHKKGLLLANGIGIIDPDYCGDEDELKAAYYNFTKEPVIILRGERIAQGTFIPVSRAEWLETIQLGNKSRGGFGSTGK